MKRRRFTALAVLVLAGIAGCSDSWAGFDREARNLKNELADYMTKVVDEETAQYVVEVPAKKIKEKWEEHKSRFENYLKGQSLNQFAGTVKQAMLLAPGDSRKSGIGKKELTFTKNANGSITVSGKVDDPAEQEAIDTLSDPNYSKNQMAPILRMQQQIERISRIQPAGTFLNQIRELPTRVFP